MYNRILVPLDGSALAEQALPAALKMAETFGAELHLVRVVRPPLGYSGPRAAASVAESRKELIEQTTGYLSGLCTNDRMSHNVVEGNPAESILAFAGEQQIDLIMLTSHGESGIGRWIFGSTAERLVKHSECPVLVMKPNSP